MHTEIVFSFDRRSLAVINASNRRYIEALFACLLTCNCTLISNSAWGDQKYISQPSRAQQQQEPGVGKPDASQPASNSQPELTAQKATPDPLQVRVAQLGEQSTESGKDSESPLLPRNGDSSRKKANRFPDLAHSELLSEDSYYALPTVPANSRAEAAIRKPGIHWVRRQPRTGSSADGIGREPLEFKALEISLQPQVNRIATPVSGQQKLDEIDGAPLQPAPANSNGLAKQSDHDWELQNSGESQSESWVEADFQQSELVSARLVASGLTQPAVPEPRIQLASIVSQRILGELEQQDKEPITQVGLTSGWASIGGQLASHIRQSEHLAARGVFLSAREECQLALLLLVRYLDHLSNSFQCEPGLHSAQTALRESADFDNYLQTADENVLRQIVHSHQTPLLKHSQLKQVSPITLAEHYRKFAESEIVKSSQNHPWFSDILYQMGRTYQAEADMTSSYQSDHLRSLSLVYYRAAVAIVPTNARAANQIGFVLLQQDRPEEARQFLIASVDAKLAAPALQNLVEASRRLRDSRMESWAVNTLAAIQSGRPAVEPIPVQVLDSSTFAAISPASSGPKTAVHIISPNSGPVNAGPVNAGPFNAGPGSTGNGQSSAVINR